MKAQPLIISLVVLVTTLVLATSHALDAKAGDEQLGHPSPLTVVKGGLIIDGTGAPAFEGEVWIRGRFIEKVMRGGSEVMSAWRENHRRARPGRRARIYRPAQSR